MWIRSRMLGPTEGFGIDRFMSSCCGGSMIGTLYDDGRCLLDQEGVTLRHYYFPFGTSKRIGYEHIREVRAQSMSWLAGKGRIWGSSHPRSWLPLDTERPRKSTLIVLDLNKYVKPSFSPADPEAVLRVLRERLADSTVVDDVR